MVTATRHVCSAGKAMFLCCCVRILRRAVLLVSLCLAPGIGLGQSLVPRAYVITPADANAITLAYSYEYGDVLFDPSIPIKSTGSQLNVAFFSYYHSFSFFGRSANVAAVLPYALANFSGTVVGVRDSIYRSGLTDSSLRLSVNLKGGPAMNVADFRDWRQKTLVGVSLTVEVPSGQYDPARLINPGTNRWAFKPEIGLSRRWGPWILDAYGGVWLFTANDRYFPGGTLRTQKAIGAIETHLSYDLKPRLWFSLDGNFWYGGTARLNGSKKISSLQEDSRVGATMSIPVTNHQSLKFSYSIADRVSFGGDFQSISAAWQYSWIGKP
jgi:outer membrane putative beta-barrel porin/alpha-amylase